MKSLRQHNSILFAVLVVAAIAVVLISVIGIAVMIDMLPGVQPPQ